MTERRVLMHAGPRCNEREGLVNTAVGRARSRGSCIGLRIPFPTAFIKYSVELARKYSAQAKHCIFHALFDTGTF